MDLSIGVCRPRYSCRAVTSRGISGSGSLSCMRSLQTEHARNRTTPQNPARLCCLVITIDSLQQKQLAFLTKCPLDRVPFLVI